MLSKIMVNLCMLSYKDSIDTIPPPFTSFYSIEKGHSRAFIFENDAFVVVVFRGTGDLGDELDDFYTETIGCVHSGFYMAFIPLLPLLQERLGATNWSTKMLLATGHSLGGAMALLFGAHFPETQFVVTFGAPKVGTKSFELSTKHFRHIRWTNGKDKVCRLPVFRYLHTGDHRHLRRSWKNFFKRDHCIKEYCRKIEKVPLSNVNFEYLLK